MTKVRRRLFLMLLLTFMLVTTSAQVSSAVPLQSPPTVITQHFTTAEGLPSNNVMCVLKDQDGFMWFGTWYGLCRFDGGKFVTFNKPLKSDSDIPPRKIENMVEDAQGVLWLKTVDWKLYTFNRRTECFHAVNDALKKHTHHLQIIKIQHTDEGKVLLLTKDKTLLLASTGKNGAINIRKLIDASGKTDPQTFQLQEDIIVQTKDYQAYMGRDYRIFYQPKGKAPLLETMDRVEAHQRQREEFLSHAVGAVGIPKYLRLYQDRDSMLWVTTASQGVYALCMPQQQFTLIPLPDDDQTGVRCLYQTRQGDIIVGARSRNVYVYDINGRLKRTLFYDDYGIGAVYHATEDAKGRLWLSTKGDGLVVATPDATQPMGYALTHYRHQADNPASISGNDVYITFIDSHQHIWVGTLDGGLNLVHEREGQLSFYNKHHGLTNYPIYGLYTEVRNIVEDKEGRLWVGTIDGLMSFDSHFDSPGEIQFKTYRQQPDAAFANNDIYTLYRDQTGEIWIGAFGGGLEKLSTGPLGPREGLRNDVVLSIVEDLQGQLWFATEAGLSCYNQQTKRIRNYDEYDGMPRVQFEETSALCCSHGQLWIGSKQGILTFTPKALQTRQHDYRTFIMNVTNDNESYVGAMSMPYTDALELEHNKNSISIEFAALKYADNAQLSYRYQLKGYDRDWHYSGTQRIASYNELPPGDYVFLVETIDDGNPSQSSSAQLAIHIKSPWWATWWAYCIYFIVAALIAWIIIRTVLQFNRMRNEIYIGQRLAKLTSKPDEGDEFIDRLHRTIRKNLANASINIDDIAAEMGLSRSALYKKVKDQTGFAPVDLMKEFRLSHAKELLETTHLSITEVAFHSGFTDSSYFGKCFRKRYGMSPRQFVQMEPEQQTDVAPKK